MERTGTARRYRRKTLTPATVRITFNRYTMNWKKSAVLLLFAVSAQTLAVSAGRKSATPQRKLLAESCARGLATITEDAARAHVWFLADDLLEGRRAGQRGSRLAKQYVVSRMREADIRPFLPSGYEQPFEACARQQLHRMGRYYVEPDSIASIRQGVYLSMQLGNVLGVLPGRQADEYVVVGAHIDHEGVYDDLAGDPIYNGADDNASGVSAVLQIMKAFCMSGAQPERTVVFAFWDGEEEGLLGSRFFTQQFGAMDRVRCYLNFDMVGSGTDSPYVTYFYTAAHPRLGEWLKADMAEHHFAFEPDYRAWDNPVGGSDQSSFHLKGVPIVWYHTGAQPHYNQPSDEPQTVNYPKLADITRAAFLTAWHMANEREY